MYIFTLTVRDTDRKSKEVSLPITQYCLDVTDKQEQRIIILHD